MEIYAHYDCVLVIVDGQMVVTLLKIFISTTHMKIIIKIYLGQTNILKDMRKHKIPSYKPKQPNSIEKAKNKEKTFMYK